MGEQARHTPGPWVVRGSGSVAIMGQRSHTDANGRSVSYLGEVAWTRPGGGEATRRANARLISAAPELAEALVNLLAEYVQLLGCGDCGNSGDPEGVPEVIAARAAIRKAALQSQAPPSPVEQKEG
jgi:hypothetical protein